MPSLEGDEAQDNELDGIVPGDGRKGGEDVRLYLLLGGISVDK
jgi:hypothetical protein